MFTLMFWNRANEALLIGSKSQFEFDTKVEAFEAAETLLEGMFKRGAVEATIHGGGAFECFPILEG